jgi:K+-transporting ATPase ATPase A chain
MLILAVLSVFIAGLMVGRTPEYLGKKLGGREIKFASLYILTTPLVALVGTALAMALPGERASMLNTGPHGLSEVLYAFTSAANNNGSAFAGISVNTNWYNTALGIAMLIGRFLPMVFVLGLAGSLARQKPVPASDGTLPTHRLLFVGLLTGVALIVVGLTYFPALALGPMCKRLPVHHRSRPKASVAVVFRAVCWIPQCCGSRCRTQPRSLTHARCTRTRSCSSWRSARCSPPWRRSPSPPCSPG